MNIHLAGINTLISYYPFEDLKDIYTLTTFFDHRNKKEFPEYCYHKKHLLDSGAFSFFGGKNLNINNYLESYINCINKIDSQLFFELDIDVKIGLDKVEEIRKKIINKTGKKPIVVWHPSRGLEYWKKMCDEYPYIAISASGMYTSAWVNNPNAILVINKMCDMAHDNGVKVHGLGYTKLKKLPYIKFDSVDSTSWLMSMKFGQFQRFNGKELIKLKRPKNTKMINPSKRLYSNFKEWVKFQKYAEQHL